MTNAIESFEKKQIEKLTGNKRVPAFRPGDTLKVTVKIITLISNLKFLEWD